MDYRFRKEQSAVQAILGGTLSLLFVNRRELQSVVFALP